VRKKEKGEPGKNQQPTQLNVLLEGGKGDEKDQEYAGGSGRKEAMPFDTELSDRLADL